MEQLAQDVRPQVEDALRERRFADVRRALSGLEPVVVAEVIDSLEIEERAVVFRVLPRGVAADAFEYLESADQEDLLKALGREHVAEILNEMSPDDRTSLLEELPASATRQLMMLLSSEERRVAMRLLGYPEESIGRLMTPDFITVEADWTVQQALDYIRRHGEDSETLNVINVVDPGGILTDDLRVRQLLLADPATPLSDLCDGQFVALRAADDQEIAVSVFMDQDRVALPVVDSDGQLLGIVTVDDVLDVAEEEATEDIQKIGGSEALDHPYMRASFVEMLRKRAGWLVLLFLAQSVTLDAMGYFTEQIAQAIVLVIFVPLIISSGGNSGSQAATLVVRALALEEVEPGDWWRVMRRELAFGLTLGASLALIGFVRILLGEHVAGTVGDRWPAVALAVGISLVFVVLWGVTVGAMLPFVLRAIGADPATSSTPVVATVVDVTGLIIYFSIASLILGL